MTIHLGDNMDVLGAMKSDCIDTIITDPPYGLRLLGNKWDYDVPSIDLFSELLRVAKPGATLLCFGGPRTSHRMTVAIEDSGWLIKDSIIWIYSSGKPHSCDISQKIDNTLGAVRKSRYIPETQDAMDWDGWGTGLKPCHEIITMAMKPYEKTYANNALKWGVAGLWINGTRIPTTDNLARDNPVRDDLSWGGTYGSGPNKSAELNINARWPGNVIHDGSPGLWAGGSESYKYFFCSKASRSEKDDGVDGGNDHPTVKPIALMKYLVRLTRTPRGGTVLDPFMGSGSTGVACKLECRDFIGIEKDQDYFDIARQRISHCQPDPQGQLI